MPARRRPGRRSRTRIRSAPGKSGKQGAGAQPDPAKKDPLLGKTVGRCRIEEYIGHGRTSVVYRASHEGLQSTVAIKVLMARSAAQPEILENFHTEARAVAQIDNENVVKIYDVGTDGSRHYIVMELLLGEEVLDILAREGRMDVTDALRVIRQAANGLAAAHARDIVHRDVKPQNLVLLEDGTVKVVDFGLAAMGTDAQKRVGTPHFMAPETCESGATSEQSDIYSLGVTLYHLLVGKPPYAGKDVKEILKAHIEGKPLAPERMRPGLPKEVAALVRTLTAKDPAARPTAIQVIEALDSIGGEALQEKGTLRRKRARMRSRIEQRKQASMVPLVLALLVVVGLIIGFIALGSGGGDAPAPKTTPISHQPTTSTPQPSGPTPADPPPRTEPTPATPIAAPKEEPKEEPAEPDPEKEAEKALAKALAWARANWKTSDDDERVLDQYRQIVESYPRSQASFVARKRIKEITAGEAHPHPDKVFSDAEAVESAKVKWRKAKPEVEELITKHLYLRAKNLLPRGADGRGTIGKNLVFYREMLGHLLQMKTGLVVYAPKLPPEKRTIVTAKGEGVVQSLNAQEFVVEIDGRRQRVPWTEIEPKTLARLGNAAFEKAPPDFAVYALAFAFAHRLWDGFWEAEYNLGSKDGVPASYDYMVKQYRERIEDRR